MCIKEIIKQLNEECCSSFDDYTIDKIKIVIKLLEEIISDKEDIW